MWSKNYWAGRKSFFFFLNFFGREKFQVSAQISTGYQVYGPGFHQMSIYMHCVSPLITLAKLQHDHPEKWFW
jgi:hypothetical protein